jgi:hypothetical protein
MTRILYYHEPSWFERILQLGLIIGGYCAAVWIVNRVWDWIEKQ